MEAIQKSLNQMMEIIEDNKRKLTDAEYKSLMDNLKVINDKKDEDNYNIYILHIMVISIIKTTSIRKVDECDADDDFYGCYDYRPMIQSVKRSVRMTESDYDMVQRRLDGTIQGIRWVHGLSDTNPIPSILDSYGDDGVMIPYTSTSISTEGKDICLNEKLYKNVRLMKIEELTE